MIRLFRTLTYTGVQWRQMMANRCHDRRTGQFISIASGRVQNLQQLADLSEDEWAIDEEALTILEAGVAKGIQDGWIPPDKYLPEQFRGGA